MTLDALGEALITAMQVKRGYSENRAREIITRYCRMFPSDGDDGNVIPSRRHYRSDEDTSSAVERAYWNDDVPF